MRLLDRQQGLIGLWEVGLDKSDVGRLEELLGGPTVLFWSPDRQAAEDNYLYSAINRSIQKRRTLLLLKTRLNISSRA